jgi:hypothetical protein
MNYGIKLKKLIFAHSSILRSIVINSIWIYYSINIKIIIFTFEVRYNEILNVI